MGGHEQTQARRSIGRILLVGGLLLGAFPLAQVSADATFYVYAPWMAPQAWTAGGSGNFWNEGGHSSANDDEYAVDFNGPGDDCGQKVLAVGSGTVSISTDLKNPDGTYRSYGRYIAIGHGSGFTSYYAHLSTRLVSAGAAVKAGDVIGTVGNTGHSGGCHLHWEIEKDGQSYQQNLVSGQQLRNGGSITSDNKPGDSTAPTLSITAPSSGAVVHATVRISATATDASGVAKVGYKVDGGSYVWDTSSPYAWDWNSKGVADGQRTLYVQAQDRPGNLVTKSITIRVDNTAPSASLEDPRPNRVYVADAASQEIPPEAQEGPLDGLTLVVGPTTMRAKASDASGIAKVEFLVDDVVRGSDATATNSYYTWTWDATAEPGPHTLAVRSHDRAGNVRTSPARSVVAV